MTLPWYRGPSTARRVHPGLVFDKFCGRWSFTAQGRAPGQDGALRGEDKREFLRQVREEYDAARGDGKPIAVALAAAVEGRRALVRAMQGASKPFKTTWRLASGLGMNHVLETGFVWHRTIGVPYLPGSGIKGLVRAWVDPAKGWADIGQDGNAAHKAREEVQGLFGTSERGIGSLVVFDALPVKPPEVEMDIMNVHHKTYYRGEGAPPSDYENPDLIYFLTVAAGQEFEFALAPRPRPDNDTGGEPDIERAFAMLQDALAILGAGAKTAAGYGRFEPIPESHAT